ncbi:CbtB domain-containing protein [Pelagibacterium xiamenense]|uniref:CbtB domain-containing protein n=1 Tax=Pelagibacterium xiamenense TaxID=2901140 RepID=UPI001E2C59C1|nr:CbtB domain-containing protein [Pelagibacterium xiamenense]MCD7058802.1 CbtB-domain containing protein [Pelagibacterium xiamenense]
MTSASISAVKPLSISQRLVLGAVFLVLGFVFVAGTGFAGDYRAHNGAHDSRHAMGFPCH